MGVPVRRKKEVYDLEEKEIYFTLIDKRTGKKKVYKVNLEKPVIEYRIGGKKYVPLMLEEVE